MVFAFLFLLGDYGKGSLRGTCGVLLPVLVG